MQKKKHQTQHHLHHILPKIVWRLKSMWCKWLGFYQKFISEREESSKKLEETTTCVPLRTTNHFILNSIY